MGSVVLTAELAFVVEVTLASDPHPPRRRSPATAPSTADVPIRRLDRWECDDANIPSG